MYVFYSYFYYYFFFYYFLYIIIFNCFHLIAVSFLSHCLDSITGTKDDTPKLLKPVNLFVNHVDESFVVLGIVLSQEAGQRFSAELDRPIEY